MITWNTYKPGLTEVAYIAITRFLIDSASGVGDEYGIGKSLSDINTWLDISNIHDAISNTETYVTLSSQELLTLHRIIRHIYESDPTIETVMRWSELNQCFNA